MENQNVFWRQSEKIMFFTGNVANIFQKYLNDTIFEFFSHFPIDYVPMNLTYVFGYKWHMLSTRTARYKNQYR